MTIISDCIQYIPHSHTRSFSDLVVHYLARNPDLKKYYRFEPDYDGIADAIAERSLSDEARHILADTLNRQYEQLHVGEAVKENIEALRSRNTYTVCTAHQPNLLGGPLYFFYKIIHAIKLADDLNLRHPDKKFVPVFYLGTEDNDLEELGNFWFYGRKYHWDTKQTGAVGRMRTDDLQDLLHSLFAAMGPEGELKDSLQSLIQTAFAKGQTIAAATRQLVHQLLGARGVLVLDPDDAALKAQFTSVMRDDLLMHKAARIVEKTSAELNRNFSAQAFPRPINLFYLKENLRQRIEKSEDGYTILDTDIRFSEDQILKELAQYPERFSPNVILRGLYQETILPNVAFIGGGAEVAYWLQLKDVFEEYGVFFPAIILRQSFLFVDKLTKNVFDKTDLSIEEIFEDVDAVIRKRALLNNPKLELSNEKDTFEKSFALWRSKARKVSAALDYSTEAVYKKMLKQLEVLEQKMLRAEKKKYEILRQRILAIRAHLYPAGSFQERKLSFMEYYLKYGNAFFEEIYLHTLPLGNQFGIIFEVD